MTERHKILKDVEEVIQDLLDDSFKDETTLYVTEIANQTRHSEAQVGGTLGHAAKHGYSIFEIEHPDGGMWRFKEK